MWALSGPFSEKLNFKFVINSKTDCPGWKNIKNCILTLNFTFSGQLGSLITSRHAFRSSWNFQKLMQVRYTSNLRIFQDVGILRIKIAKKTYVEQFFFQFLMLNISSIKKLLHKPSEIQWNITATLPGKLKRKTSWVLSYKIFPPEITKMWELLFLVILWGPGNTNVEFNGFLWFCEFLKASVSIFCLKAVLTLN